jgi:hypothetical protein
MAYTSEVLNRYPEQVEDLYQDRDNDLALATYVEFAGYGLNAYLSLEGIVPFEISADGRADWDDVLPLSQSDYEVSLQRLDALAKQ